MHLWDSIVSRKKQVSDSKDNEITDATIYSVTRDKQKITEYTVELSGEKHQSFIWLSFRQYIWL